MQSRASAAELDNGLFDVRPKPKGKEVRETAVKEEGREEEERRVSCSSALAWELRGIWKWLNFTSRGLIPENNFSLFTLHPPTRAGKLCSGSDGIRIQAYP